MRNNYYFSSFFWSTFSKIINAVLGFITVPLLLGYFGKAEYGLLSIATACNGYMHLMDLGMNVGAVKFYSQWIAEGDRNKLYRVSRTNISFYLIISTINILGLLILAFWGERFFAITHTQFLQLRICLLILSLFSAIQWVSTAFHQLLIADKQIAFTMQIHCVQSLLKMGLIAITIWGGLNLSMYFFWLILIIAIAFIPYVYKCKHDKLIDSIIPARYWGDFKVVLTFSLSIFALSLFQVTATQSRPILLSIFSESGAESVAEFRIVEVIPSFIIMLSGSFLSIFLPKSSEMIVRNNKEEIVSFLKKWTSLTTIIVCILCFPFIVSHSEIIAAYVGESYSYLGKWVVLWCVFLIVQQHSTPAYSLLLANGRTKVLVWSTGIACIISMIANAVLCKLVPVGSAVIGYSIYMIILILVYYLYFYKKYLHLKRWFLIKAFLTPVIPAFIACIVPLSVNLDIEKIHIISFTERIDYFVLFGINAVLWFFTYILLLRLFHIIPTIKFYRK